MTDQSLPVRPPPAPLRRARGTRAPPLRPSSLSPGARGRAGPPRAPLPAPASSRGAPRAPPAPAPGGGQ
eukprot:9218118-Pyramimonas_sp.AAC.1